MNIEELKQQSRKGTNIFILFFLPLVIGPNVLHAQDPPSYKWKNRVLLILVNDLTDDVFIKQMNELNAHISGLDERKLIVYNIQPNRYAIGVIDQKWQQSKRLYKQYKKTQSSIEIILLGLDGSEKLHRTNFLSAKELFNAIDAMPMRRSEKQ